MTHAGFTDAGCRALQEAARWSCQPQGAALGLPEVLLGLLAEEECRAAALLAGAGIDRASVCGRWPALQPLNSPPPGRQEHLSADLHAALIEARARLHELPQPLLLATEHLLLGVLAAPSEVAQWLQQRGLTANLVQTQIFRWERVTQGPLVFEVPAAPEPLATPAVSRSASEFALWRLLDAAANRAREGLRVVEDYARFVRNDRELSQALKTHRHELAALLDRLPVEKLLASRDTPGDVGATITTAAEQSRADLPQVLTANFKRLQEALRSLEEYSKLIDPGLALGLEQLRYRTYTLEQQVVPDRAIRARLHAARLYVLIDGRASLAEFETLARTLIDAGVQVLQLRDKRLPDRELLERARRLRQLTQHAAALFIMNDRPDLALLAEADGVHVGQDELAVSDARNIVGAEALVGVSTHSLLQARQAVAEGADYIGVGPTFPSATKQFAAFTGLELLAAVAREIPIPAFAIGGISRENLPSVLSVGMQRIAVSAAVCEAPDPAAATRDLLTCLR